MAARNRRKVANDEKKRCAIYTRKSTTAGLNEDFNSLDAQREACTTYIHRQPGWVVIEDRYDDGGFSGANIERPAFRRLLTDVDAGKVDVVLVYKVDRLSRSLLDFAKVVERFNAKGASFVSVTQNFSTADAMGRLTLNMLMSFAEFEREMIAERTRDKIAASRKKGKWTGGVTPLGYRLKDKRLEVDELEAGTVREAFDLTVQLRQRALVARTLNERGLLPRGAKRRAGKTAQWTKDSIARLLRNPVYAGMLPSGDEQYPGQHQALVDTETFDLVQRILKCRGPFLKFDGRSFEYLLRGLIRCGICGQFMAPVSTTKGERRYRYYRCTTRNNAGEGRCVGHHVSASAVEVAVTSQVATLDLAGLFAEDVFTAVQSRLGETKARLDTLEAALPERIRELTSNLARLADERDGVAGAERDRIEALIVAESERLDTARARAAFAAQSSARLARMDVSPRVCAAKLRDLDLLWASMPVNHRGRLLRALLEYVEVVERTDEVVIRAIDFSADRSRGPQMMVGSVIREPRRRENPKRPPELAAQTKRPARVARLLSLAHRIQALLDDGHDADRASVARGFGVSGARLSQVMDLLLLAPDIQADVLELEAVGNVEPMSEASLRAIAREARWSRQRVAWLEMSNRTSRR